VLGTSRAILNADQFNVLQVVKPFFPQLLSRYRCSPDFYTRIAASLSGTGLSVSVGRWMKASGSGQGGEIGYVVTDGHTSVNLSGGVLPDGTRMFLLATEPTWKFWGFGKRNAFYQRVHSSLLSFGVDPLGSKPLQNQSTDPTFSSGAPGAAHQPRHP
jgi:hypothetical protein